MNRILTLAAALATVISGWAELPILVGHRGSSYGLENSVESFTNGAKRGYQYLETDFKVTKDNKLVCTHDDDISRLSGGTSTLTIAGSTLEELQAVELSQTRLGTKYTGRLCSAQEYLDVCKEHGVRPLIELKWATGINNNDQSNIPMLIKLVEDNGFRDKCIILTSMKPCLEYIRTNYPDIELQFLTGQYWANHFDWCVKWKIDVDIQAGYFDKATVQKYHDAGLKVNMWTTNDAAGYKQYGNWGCDFITTDNLDGHNLPDLDASVTFPPNTVDFPNHEGELHGSYSPLKTYEGELPEQLAGLTVRRAVMHDGVWSILAAGNDGAQAIHRVDAATGTWLGTYKMTGVESALGDIAMTADGILLASQTATVPFAAAEALFKIFRWDNAEAEPSVFLTFDKSEAILGNWNNSVVGEVMAASGRIDDLKLYISTHSNAGTTYRIAGVTVTNGAVDPAKSFYCADASYTRANWGDFRMSVSPFSRQNIIVDSPTMTPVEYTFNWEGNRLPMTEYGRPAEGLVPAAADGLSFVRRSQKVYAMFPACAADGSKYTATAYDVTDGLAAANAVTGALLEGLGDTPAAYTATAFSVADGGTYMHLLAVGQGMATFRLEGEQEDETVYKVDLELTRDWIMANTTGNHPGNIDGTNAQQGTAVNGYFYINNCAEALIHVFDQSGHLGTLPGGKGWGCARDDAGNIVVRDDKDIEDSHVFLIYPAGTLPGSDVEAVRLQATGLPVTGQTNFISAGGDLLGGTGHIYLYPNKQTAINIITVVKGEYKGAAKSAELAMAGSTAGYVVPVDDDTENFLYQVRGTGVYQMKNGANEAVFGTRQSTSAPARNNTGGTAWFKLRGNRIYAHNSGANYKGGFTVRNMTADDGTLSSTGSVITTISPIGSLGYETGGNYSTFNWLIPERIDDYSWHIYQYCPANGIAVYTLRDKSSGVSDIAAPDTDAATLHAVCRDGLLTLSAAAAIGDIEIYSVAGHRVMTARGYGEDTAATVDVSTLTPGLYIVRAGSAATAKFVR